MFILAGFNLAQGDIVKPENARKTALNAHNVHLLFIEVKAVHGLLSAAHTSTVLLKVPRIIFVAYTGHRRHKWRILSVDHSSCYAMTLSADVSSMCAQIYKDIKNICPKKPSIRALWTITDILLR
ncbi:MAG TPA: hypothetical protein VF393_03435 [archaeon]